MTRQRRSSTIIAAILLVVIALPWLIDPAFFIRRNASDEHHQTSQALRDDQIPTATIDRPTIEQFSAIVERPVFVATRRPTFSPDKLAGENLVLGKYRLTGIIISPEEQVVMLTSAVNKQTVTLRPGDQIDGWSLGEVSESKIVLISEKKRIVIRDNTDR